MKCGYRVEISTTNISPSFRDAKQCSLGEVIGFYGSHAVVVLDQPIVLPGGRHQRVVRVPIAPPIPVEGRCLARTRVKTDVRPLCTSRACDHQAMTLVAFENKRYAVYCGECTRTVQQAFDFVSASPLDSLWRMEVAVGVANPQETANIVLRYVHVLEKRTKLYTTYNNAHRWSKTKLVARLDDLNKGKNYSCDFIEHMSRSEVIIAILNEEAPVKHILNALAGMGVNVEEAFIFAAQK